MTAKTEVLDQIRRALSIWSTDLKLNSKVNRLSDHISSEDVAAGLLKRIYGYQLRNANEIHPNHKAVDLVDTDAEDGGGVAVQISTSNTMQKAKKTIRGFCDDSDGDPLCDEYSKLIFLILTVDDKFPRWDTLFGEGYELSIRNLTDLSTDMEYLELDRMKEILSYLNRELLLETAAQKPGERISRIAHIIDADAVAIAAGELTEADTDKFYMVDLNFPRSLRVVSKGRDVPHEELDRRLMELCRTGAPAILTGYSGTGKSVIMLRTAVSWARSGGVALWLSLDEDTTLNDGEAAQFYADVLRILPEGKRALLCLDSPSLWPAAFSALGRSWPGDPRLQLLLAERSNRLLRMTDAAGDLLHHWFDGATVAAMMFENERDPLRVKDYDIEYIPDTYQRKLKILERAVAAMFRKGGIKTVSERDAVRQIMKDYNKGSVSLVELIYRAQFRLKDFATAPENLRMDWDEWQRILRRELKIKKDAAVLYGVVALCSFFEVPITASLFCRHFGLKESDLILAINKWRMNKSVEPVIYREGSGTLLPKHDVVAELFFLFHKDTLPVNELMKELLELMDEYEIEPFLEKIVRKGPLQRGYQWPLGKLLYRDYLMTIYRRFHTGSCGLFSEGRARLALGLLYTVPKKDRRVGEQTLPLVEELDPGLDGSVLTASLYTEWGRLLTDMNRKTDAEERLREVAEKYPRQLHARTELGRLLSRQPGREGEAEQFLRDTVKIKPDDIQSRTELGRLLSRQPGREGEAEQFLREAMQIEPSHIQSRTELGRLLSRQPGREVEAEQYLREAIKIDPKNLHPHTELGRLLSRQPGREGEAEQFLREAMQIDPSHIQSRTELGRLLSRQPGREGEAEEFLREAIRIDPKNLHPHTELGRLLSRQPGREGEAEEFLREAIRIDPKNLHPRIELAKLCIRDDRWDEAERLYREVQRLDPGNIYAKDGLVIIANHRPTGQ